MAFTGQEAEQVTDGDVVRTAGLHAEKRLRPCCFTVKFHVAPRLPLLFHRHVGRGTSTRRRTCRSGRGLGSAVKEPSGAGGAPQARTRPPTAVRGAISPRGR